MGVKQLQEHIRKHQVTIKCLKSESNRRRHYYYYCMYKPEKQGERAGLGYPEVSMALKHTHGLNINWTSKRWRPVQKGKKGNTTWQIRALSFLPCCEEVSM